MSEELKEKIVSRVVGDLQQIETELAENLHPYLELVSEIARHILFSGGKRLRPLLMVISARLCGYNGGFVHKFSTIFEYLHAATLLHDDLVDGAAIRRGRPVAHTVWDPATVVLVGDFLLARSLTIAAETGRSRVIRVIAEITENMSQGEIQQLLNKGSARLSEDDYMEVIRRKTAVLFQGACRVSGILADVSEQQELALAEYGGNLGLAFQMADDLLDYTVDSEKLGKLVGADLREGKLTLPVISSLKQAGGSDRWQMVEIIRNRDFSPEEFQWLIERLQKYGGIDYTRKRARDHIEIAKQALTNFEDSADKQLLLDIADYALLRQM
ncbi:MAG: polyprenyl synthetase [Deltaproteobacteria bacterium SG8_13]|nr:MAG: polyprenyl synthetase [Deltaproteobacteria bacterium SG8_13]